MQWCEHVNITVALVYSVWIKYDTKFEYVYAFNVHKSGVLEDTQKIVPKIEGNMFEN